MTTIRLTPLFFKERVWVWAFIVSCIIMRDKRRRLRQKIMDDDQGKINVFNEEQLATERSAETMFEGTNMIRRRVHKVQSMGKN